MTEKRQLIVTTQKNLKKGLQNEIFYDIIISQPGNVLSIKTKNGVWIYNTGCNTTLITLMFDCPVNFIKEI